MNATLQQNRLMYQKQLLQNAMKDLDLAKRCFTLYRSQVVSGYDAQEMHYIILSINEVLQLIHTMQQEAQYLLEQFRYVALSLT